MKKLMVMAAIVCAAIGAQAAMAIWQTDDGGMLYGPDDVECWGEGHYTMYGFVITEASVYDSFATAENVSKSVWNAYKNSLATAPLSAVDDAGAGYLTLSDDGGYGAGDTAYIAIVCKYTDEDEVWYKGNVGKVSFESATDALTVGMDSIILGANNGTEALGWTKVENPGPEPIPEPFSGTLALLGMGAIALRRKMKKAKKA